jgi:glutathione S-transferase
MILYDYRPSQNGWKIRVLLGLLWQPYETREVSIFRGEGQTGAFLKLNPTGAVPVLQLEDGRTIAESSAILIYLAEGTQYLPADRYMRAKINQWLSFEQYHVEPVIGSLRFWTLTGRLELHRPMVDSKRAGATRALVSIDRALSGTHFLVGDRLSIADIALYAYTHLAGDCGFDPRTYPALSAWLTRVAEAIGPGYPVYPYTVDPLATISDGEA